MCLGVPLTPNLPYLSVGKTASHAGILRVEAIVHAPTVMSTVHQPSLISSAVNVVEVYPPHALSVVRSPPDHLCGRVAELSAGYVSVGHDPAIVTHCTPLAIVVHLQPAFVWTWAIHKAKSSINFDKQTSTRTDMKVP